MEAGQFLGSVNFIFNTCNLCTCCWFIVEQVMLTCNKLTFLTGQAKLYIITPLILLLRVLF